MNTPNNYAAAAQKPMHANVQPAQMPAGFAFTLDENSAISAGETPYITETNAYVVDITRAEYVRAGTGSHGLRLRFIADDKQGSVTLNYMKADNTKIFGADFINAILYLCSIPGFNWYNAQDENGRPIQVAGELANQRIGLVLESVKNQNDDGRHLALRQVFDPVSRCTASEAKNGEMPEAVDKLLARLVK